MTAISDWRDWTAKVAATGHSSEVGDTPHPGDVAEVWCASPTCETDSGSPAWPCPSLLTALGIDTAEEFWRMESELLDAAYAEQHPEYFSTAGRQ